MFREMFRKKKYLVYSLPQHWAPSNIHPVSFKWVVIDSYDLLKIFFDKKGPNYVTFMRFIDRGFRGLIWYDEDQWASYAWLSLPSTFGPPHLPRNVRKLPYYWIFYCRTRVEYQGRGLYKASLNLLSKHAREADPNAQVYIDTEPRNFPSRRAIKSVGFVPAGVISNLFLRLPRVRLVVWERWDRKAWYPEIEHA